ncbi:hypothetical protein Pint_32203 [Pistacia integerrima]|uniref:Uncharacterized protein n=1 Tax=Pistacia integerrima TaxID=434235 RepID=A0ACC0XPX1_9ROSI|nr:hypothetical protein Pint_32203 [Pistacia integerrima]
MDLRSSPIPSKTQPVNPKSTRKSIVDVLKTKTREPNISRQKRVFVAAKNTNIPKKEIPNNHLNKPSMRVPQKQPKPTALTKNVATTAKTDEISRKTSPKKGQLKLKKRGFCVQNQQNILQQENVKSVVSPRTPVALPSLIKSNKTESTPYRTAEKCSKRRFDRLETASYWLGQIKLAESVGKHFVSAAFFSLAFELRAETCVGNVLCQPIRNLGIELKRYLARHRFLSTQREWRDVSLMYKLQKEEDKGRISGIEEDGVSNIKFGCSDQCQINTFNP